MSGKDIVNTIATGVAGGLFLASVATDPSANIKAADDLQGAVDTGIKISEMYEEAGKGNSGNTTSEKKD